MIKTNLILNSKVDALPLSVLTLSKDPPASCHGILLFVHGMCEYKERYLPIMEFMAEHGFYCVIHDHRGHGKSIRSSRDLGYMYGAGIPGLIEDLHLIYDYARSQAPDLPIYMIGHSMGSLITRVFLKSYDHLLNGVILSGPPSKNPAVDLAIFLTKFQIKLFGEKHRGDFLEKLAFSSYKAPFRKEGSSHAWVCSDPEVVKAYDLDPLCGFVFSLDAFGTLFALLKSAYSPKDWNCKNPSLPILFLGGMEDPCMGGSQKLDSQQAFLRSCGYTQVSGKCYPHLRHEIFQEKEKLSIYEEILQWIP